MNDLSHWIWLTRIENVSKKLLFDLLQKYKTPKNMWNLTKEELINSGITKKNAQNITNTKYKQNLSKYVDYMQKTRVELISIKDEHYPKSLKNIYDPPIALYIKGDKEILNSFGIAIIGARKASLYGETVAKQFACDLANSNINIVSGGARGIDTSAHLRCFTSKI